MYHQNILPIAFEDIKSNANCYSTQKKGLGLKFTRAVRSEIKKIINNPYAFVNRYDKHHTCVMKKYPYMIHYIIDDELKTITITAVFSTKQSPDIWYSRR